MSEDISTVVYLCGSALAYPTDSVRLTSDVAARSSPSTLCRLPSYVHHNHHHRLMKSCQNATYTMYKIEEK